MAKEIVHEDFGEKIGGAKKDLWAARGLYVDDLLGMNEREADKYVKKDNVWKKPDYNALIQSGVPVDILYFRKVVRDSLNASPRYLRSDDTPEKRLARQKEYIATVRQVQEAVEKVQTVKDAMDVFDALIIDGGYHVEKDISVSPPKWTVYFKASQADAIEAAFKKYTQKTVKRENRPSLLSQLSKFKEIARKLARDPVKNKEHGGPER